MPSSIERDARVHHRAAAIPTLARLLEVSRNAFRLIARTTPHSFDPDRLDRRDLDLIATVHPLFREFASRYVQLEVEGSERLARTSPALIVSNHNGGIMGPDLACMLSTLWDTFGIDAPVYALAHDFAMVQLPLLGERLQRLGALRASRSNAHRALERGGQLLVYPGGDYDAYRSFAQRNQIVLGTRTGFVRVAREAGVPIVPVVVHGAHRSAFVLHDGEAIARAIRLKSWGRLERFPVALALPWGLALGPWTPYLPLPFRIRMQVLEPVHVDPGADAAEVREQIRDGMQRAMTALAAKDARS